LSWGIVDMPVDGVRARSLAGNAGDDETGICFSESLEPLPMCWNY